MTNQSALKFYKNGYAYNNDLCDEMTVSSASQSINHYHNFYIFKINEIEQNTTAWTVKSGNPWIMQFFDACGHVIDGGHAKSDLI